MEITIHEAIRLLLVEDNPHDELIVRRALAKRAPAAEFVCVDSLAGVSRAVAESGSLDAVLLDLSLPDSEPEETFASVSACTPGVPIIVLTGIEDEQLALDAMRQGAQDYLVKGHVPLDSVLFQSLQYALARHRTEVARQARAKSFRNLVEQAPDMVFRYLFVPTSRLEYANRAMLKTLAYSDIEGLDAAISQRGIVIPGQPDIFAKRSVADSERVLTRLLTKTGQERSVDVNIAGITDELGTMIGIEGIARDNTTEERQVRELGQAQNQLIESQRMEAVGQLAGGVAHDFNNLLTVILSCGQLVLESLPSDHSVNGEVRELIDAAQRGAHLSSQLLSFSRRRAIVPCVLDLNDVVRGVSKMLGRLLGDNIELSTVLNPGLWSTRVDRGAIEQVVVNLAVNARDAMPRGGSLTLATANVELDEGDLGDRNAELSAGQYVMLAVADTGTGMNADTTRQIFEPFFTTKEPGKGTGLGLSTCYGIVRQAGGDIRVDSEVNRGTTFKVYLPRTAARPSAIVKTTTDSSPQRGDETILLVEDEEQVRRIVNRSLHRLGYRVIAVGSGQEALALADEDLRGVSLLLTDMMMPGMTGKELAGALLPRFPNMDVLYMSGYTADSITYNGKEDENIDLVQKPFDPKTIATRVRAALDRRACSNLSESDD